MKAISGRRVRCIGEAMVEMAPIETGLYRRGFAGDTFNTGWHMARWLGAGAEIGFVTRIGTDSLSAAFAAEMARDGMALSAVSQDPVRGMGLYMIERDGAERSFHYWRETSAARHLADDPAALAQAVEGAGLVHLSGITLAILAPAARETLFATLAAFRAAGGVVSFDPNIRPRLWASPAEMRDTVSRMLAGCDIALPSLDDEQAHFGDVDVAATVDRMVASGVVEGVVKNGAGPMRQWWAGGWRDHPVAPAPVVRDTTGAGDSFNAGYLAARVAGHPPERAVGAGQMLAAAVLGQFGARADAQAIDAFPRLL